MTANFLQMTRPRERRETEQAHARRVHGAFDMVYPRARRVALAVCDKRSVNPSEREDVFQQTMMELYTLVQKGKVDGQCTLFTLIFTIAQRRSVDAYRKGLREGGPRASGFGEGREDQDPVESLWVESAWETSTCARAALHDVSTAHPNWFEVFMLLAIGEMDSAQAAKALGVTSQWLRNILVAVRKTIKESCMRHCGVADCTEARAA